MPASLAAARHSAQSRPQRLHRTTRAPTLWTAQRGASCRRHTAAYAVKAVEVQRSLDLLQIVQVRGLVELKRAYYERIRELHPDVNQDRDTTDEAAAVNAAYDTLCEVRPTRGQCAGQSRTISQRASCSPIRASAETRHQTSERPDAPRGAEPLWLNAFAPKMQGLRTIVVPLSREHDQGAYLAGDADEGRRHAVHQKRRRL